MNNNLNLDTTVVIRSVGENTEASCLEIMQEIFGEENVFLVKNIHPFSKAVEQTFQLGIKQDKKWTIAIDADVLIFKDKIIEFLDLANKHCEKNKNTFCLEGKLFDKFSNIWREVGLHVYQTKYLKKALTFVENGEKELRPETFVKINMCNCGYGFYVNHSKIGIHDFFQHPKHILKKAILHCKKHTNIDEMEKFWSDNKNNDKDFDWAIKGAAIAKELADSDIIVDYKYMDQFIEAYAFDFGEAQNIDKLSISKEIDKYNNTEITDEKFEAVFPILKNKWYMKLIKKEKQGNRRIITILNFIKIKYKNKNNSTKFEELYAKRFAGLSHTEIEYIVKQQYKYFKGKEFNEKNPQGFSEKTKWLKLYNQDPLITKCADKVKGREYFSEHIEDSEQYLVKQYGVFDSVEQIDFETLPNQFVLKSNWGSGTGGQIIVKDKSMLDIKETKEKMEKWLDYHSNLYYTSFEYGYKNIVPKLICEEFLDFEYKIEFFCFSGEPKFFWTVFDDKTPNTSATFYNMDWEKMPVQDKYPLNDCSPEKPSFYNELVEVAKKLSGDFPFVRVDFYKTKNSWKFSELTFYHRAGFTHFKPDSYDIEFGNMIKLPSKKRIENIKRTNKKAYNEQYYAPKAQKSYTSAKEIIKILTKYIKPTSVCDVGCGLGVWLKTWQDFGVERLQGLDGNDVKEDKLFIPRENIKQVNLENYKYTDGKNFDLAMSLEVAEHISAKNAENFVRNLVNMSDIVMFSAAVTHQDGFGHVNCNPPKYWVDLFRKFDYACFDIIRPALFDAHENVSTWYIQNILLFVHKDKKEIFEKFGFKETINPFFFYHNERVEIILNSLAKK